MITRELLERIKANDPTLAEIKIESISEEGFCRLTKALENNTIVTRLSIEKFSDDTMSGKAEIALSQLLSANKNLMHVNLGKQKISDEASENILASLRINHNLMTFDCGLNPEKVASLLKGNKLMAKTVVYLLQEFLDSMSPTEFSKIKESPINTLLALAGEEDSAISFSMLIDSFKQLSPTIPKAQMVCDTLMYLASLNRRGHTPLHLAAGCGLMHYFDELIAIGFSVNDRDQDGALPVDLAILYEHTAAAKALAVPDHKETKYEKVKLSDRTDAEKTLCVAFTSNKLKDTDPAFSDPIPIYAYEGYALLIKYFDRFRFFDGFAMDRIDRKEKYKKLNAILENLKFVVTLENIRLKAPEFKKFTTLSDYLAHQATQSQATATAVIKKLNTIKTGRVIFLSGFVDHALGVNITKLSSSEFELNIGERGYFSDLFSAREAGKRASIKTIKIPKHLLQSVIHLLCNLNLQDENTAFNEIFVTIPKLVGAKYQDHPHLTQSPFKEDICSFGNPKTMLYFELVAEFGPKDGNLLYKSFTLFMRQEIYKDYQAFLKSKPKLNERIKSILLNKNEKFQKRFFDKKSDEAAKDQTAAPSIERKQRF